jgi:outer membrane lipoprotein-sorting protein
MRAMRRRALLLAPLFLPLAAHAQTAALSPQDRADIARVETYLNSIKTLQGRFLQIAPDGGTSEGQAWLQRPGRMRFQYDPPSPFLLVGGHGLLVFHDAQLQQTSNIPLGQTPLGLLLQDNLRLSGDVTVSQVVRLPGQLQVSLYRTASPQDGTLTLIFADNPLVLRSWIVTDAQRRNTRVTLYNVQLGGTFDQKLFQFIDPRFFQNNNGGNGSG